MNVSPPPASEPPSRQYSEPGFDRRAGQYAQLIGYNKRTDGTRFRAFFRFGKDQAAANAQSLLKQREWAKLVEWHKKAKAGVHFPTAPQFQKPYWGIIGDTMAAIEAGTRELEQVIDDRLTSAANEGVGLTGIAVKYSADRPEAAVRVTAALSELDPAVLEPALSQRGLAIVRRSSAFKPPMEVTIAQAKDLFLQHKAKEVGLAGGRGIKPQTFNVLTRTINLALGISTAKKKSRLAAVRKPVDLDKPLHQITRADLESYVNFWMALPEGISDRTAANYCAHFKQLLDWCERQEAFDFTLPRGADELFRFRGLSKTKAVDYNAATLKTLMAAAPEIVRLAILLGLNAGLYVQDIADLIPGDLVDHEGHRALWRRRSKTSHQNEFETLHVLWPETLQLLGRCQASKNSHGRLLLNDAGEPLQLDEVGKPIKRSLARAYAKAQSKAGVDLCFKQLRKIGYNAIKKIAGRDIAEMYAGHAVPGVSKHYDKADYGPLTVALLKWREQLMQDGVLQGNGNCSCTA